MLERVNAKFVVMFGFHDMTVVRVYLLHVQNVKAHTGIRVQEGKKGNKMIILTSLLAVLVITLTVFLMMGGGIASSLPFQTVYAARTSSNETLSMTMNFHLTDVNVTGFFTVDSLTAKTISRSICPSGNCQISIEDQTTPTMYKFGANYVVNANLKVSTTNGVSCYSQCYAN
jgi:hypothetical protein